MCSLPATCASKEGGFWCTSFVPVIISLFVTGIICVNIMNHRVYLTSIFAQHTPSQLLGAGGGVCDSYVDTGDCDQIVQPVPALSVMSPPASYISPSVISPVQPPS